MKGHPFHQRLGYAVRGWRVVWRSERSFRTQVIAATIAGAATPLAPSIEWIALIVFATSTVLALECLNAAIEYLADTLHPALSPGIGAAKDAAAGAVLIASLAAIGVAAAFVYRLFS